MWYTREHGTNLGGYLKFNPEAFGCFEGCRVFERAFDGFRTPYKGSIKVPIHARPTV